MGKVACFAEYAVVPEAGCIPAPAGLDFPAMALIGCSVTTGVGAAVFNAGVQPGDSVAVIGCGGVGLNVLQGARLAGATTIVAVDVKDAALAFAQKFGATHVVNARTENAVERVQALTGGGAHFAFEAYGSGATTRMAVDMLRKRGTAVIVGIAPIGDTATHRAGRPSRAMEKTIRGSYYGSARPRQDMPRIADWARAGPARHRRARDPPLRAGRHQPRLRGPRDRRGRPRRDRLLTSPAGMPSMDDPTRAVLAHVDRRELIDLASALIRIPSFKTEETPVALLPRGLLPRARLRRSTCRRSSPGASRRSPRCAARAAAPASC